MEDNGYTLNDNYQAAISYIDAVLNGEDDLADDIRDALTTEELITGFTLLTTALLSTITTTSHSTIPLEAIISRLRTNSL